MTTLPPTLPRASERADNRTAAGVEPPWPPHEPPQPSALGPLRPVVERWPLVLLVTLLFVGGAVAASMSRTPTYRAESEINVGRTDVRVQALPGYVAGASSLANAYSRVVSSDRIVDRVADATGRSRGDVAAALSAAPVPENPILRVIGEGRSSDDAVALAAAGTRQLERYVARTDSTQADLDRMLEEFQAESRRAAELRRRLAAAEGDPATAIAPAAGAEESTADDEAALRVEYETARLRAESLGESYKERRSELAGTAGIEVISRAAAAGSDRNSMLQRFVAVAIVAGVIVGSALALLLGARAARRRRPRGA